MVRKNSWSKQEDLVLVSLIFQSVNYKTSVSAACEVASIKLGRSYEACKSRWQKQLRKKHSFSDLNQIIGASNYADWVVDAVDQIAKKA